MKRSVHPRNPRTDDRTTSHRSPSDQTVVEPVSKTLETESIVDDRVDEATLPTTRGWAIPSGIADAPTDEAKIVLGTTGDSDAVGGRET